MLKSRRGAPCWDWLEPCLVKEVDVAKRCSCASYCAPEASGKLLALVAHPPKATRDNPQPRAYS